MAGTFSGSGLAQYRREDPIEDEAPMNTGRGGIETAPLRDRDEEDDEDDLLFLAGEMTLEHAEEPPQETLA